MTKEPLQQAHDALITSLAYVDATSAIAEVQGALKAIEQAIAQEQEIARRCYTCKSFAIRNVDKCRSCNKDYSNWEPKP